MKRADTPLEGVEPFIAAGVLNSVFWGQLIYLPVQWLRGEAG